MLRWGKGWACPGCGHAGYAELKGRAVYQCNRCKRQVGLTAGTVFHWTKLPLIVWFLAIYPHFNRRYQLDTLTERLAYACARTAPHPYQVVIAG